MNKNFPTLDKSLEALKKVLQKPEDKIPVSDQQQKEQTVAPVPPQAPKEGV